MHWLNRALLNLAEDPANWGHLPYQSPKRLLRRFKGLHALPLAGGIGAAHSRRGLYPEREAKALLAMTASYAHRYAKMAP